MTASRSQRLLIGLVAAVTLLAIGLCGAVAAVGLYLSSPARSIVGAPPADLPGAEPVEIPSSSGSRLHGWWLSTPKPGGGAVVLLHGVWSNRRHLVARASVLHAAGFGVLLFDFSAHGETDGARITFGSREALDAAAAVAFIHARQPGERVGVIGQSMGGAAAVLGTTPLAIDALVLESVYGTIQSALSNRLRIGLGPALGPLFTPILTPLFTLLLPPVLGVAPDQLRPIDHIGQVKAPLLLLSGDQDARTPIAEARDLFDHAPDPKQFWAVPGAAHVDLERFDTSAYWQIVLPFLKRTLVAAR